MTTQQIKDLDAEIMKRPLSKEGEMFLRIHCIPQSKQTPEAQEENWRYLMEFGLMEWMKKELKENPI